jgi:hypothetical protein
MRKHRDQIDPRDHQDDDKEDRAEAENRHGVENRGGKAGRSGSQSIVFDSFGFGFGGGRGRFGVLRNGSFCICKISEIFVLSHTLTTENQH